MRTTVAIDADNEQRIRDEIRRTGRTFRAILNEAIRRGLGSVPPEFPPNVVEPLFTAPFPTALDDHGFNHLADELDDHETLAELNHSMAQNDA
jgi:hypothetical protein